VRESTAAGLFASSEGAHRISDVELARRLESADPPLVLDVRTRSQYERDLIPFRFVDGIMKAWQRYSTHR
jgi:hypothetical protein